MITAITNNTDGAWIDGVFHPDHVMAGHYRVVWSAGFSTNGLKHYVLEESFAADFSSTNVTWFLGGENLQTLCRQFYLMTNGTYYYRISATDSNEESTAWSPIVGKTVNMALPYPPSTPAITSLVRNITEDIWVGGVLQSNYLHAADYIIQVSTSSSGEGVNFYEIERTRDPTNFLNSENNPNVTVHMPHYPDPTSPYGSAVQQFFCQSNGTYYFRVRAVDANGFKSPWSTAYPGPYSNITVSMPEGYPPSTPRITSITNNIQNLVFSNGVLVPYTLQAHFMIHLSPSTSGAGVNVYEIQETRNPTNFAYVDELGGIPGGWLGDTNAPVQVIAPHYPDAEYPTNDHPVYQFYLKGNGTYYYRVHAKDINGFFSDWDTAYDPGNPGAYAHITVDAAEPTPPEVPALTTGGVQNVDGDIVVTFPPAAAGGNVNVYEIQLSEDPGFASTNEVHYESSPGYVFSDLPEGTYYIRVRTEDWNAFKSDWSPVVSFTIDWPEISDLRVESVGTNTAVLSWTTDVPAPSEVERRGMYRVFDTWHSPTVRVQAVNYAPGEVYGARVTTNDILTDLEQLRSNNVNVLNLYNLGWSELQENGDVERFIFDKARELGMQIVIRLEDYNKYHDDRPAVGDNLPSKHFAYREEDADWIIDRYTSNAHVFCQGGYAETHGDVIAYYLINLPFDDGDLVRSDGIGLDDYPTREQQRRYVSYLCNRVKKLDPGRPVFVNVFYGGTDNLPHFELADLVDGISVVAYPERVDSFYRSYAHVPGMEDPDYLLIMKDVFEYHLDKHQAVNGIAALGKPIVIDQTGFCEINNAETGRVKDKRSKARAIRRLASLFESNSVADFGWTYFKVHDKFDAGGEWATWGLVDSRNVFLDYFEQENGRWTNAAGAWSASGNAFRSSGGGTDLALLDVGQKLGGIEAEFNASAAGQTNIFAVIAFADTNNYRYAGYDGSHARWVIGEVSNGVDTVLASTDAASISVRSGTNYTLRVVVNLNSVRLDVGLHRRVAEYTFGRFLPGPVGLLARDGCVPVNWFKTYGQIYKPAQATQHTFVLNELYPGTSYRVRAVGGGGASGYTNFVTAEDPEAAAHPSITVLSPRFGNELATGGTYVIEWRAENPYGDALIDLYYDTAEKAQVEPGCRPGPADFKGLPIASGIAATNGMGRHTWNLAGVTAGSYYVYARIRRPSGAQPDEFDYSSGKLVLSTVQMPALRTAVAPAVDGVLDEGAWAAVPATVYAVAGASTSDASAAVKILWDDVYLYMGFDVDDPEVRGGLGVWDTDGVGCYVHNGRASLNKADVLGHTHIEYVGAHSNDVSWGLTAIAARTNAGGYQVEMRFRWEFLRTIPQRLGIVPCDFLLADRDDAGSVTNLSWDGLAVDKAAGRSLRLVNSLVEFDPRPLHVVIGTNDSDHQEFAQEGSAYQAYYYPDTTPLTNFPRELNVNWWQDQYIVLDVDYHSAASGLLVTFDITASADEEPFHMRVGVENASGSNTIDTVALTATNRTYLVIPASNLNVGVNTIHLHGDSGATWMLWDQIVIVPHPYTVHLDYTNGVDYFPAASAEQPHYTAAACAWMITRYLKGESFTQTQAQIYNATAHDPAHNNEITPASCASWMQGRSWPPYWFAALSQTNVRAALREIVYWMDYIPPGGGKTPAYLVCGTNWAYKVGRGFQTDKKPYDGGSWQNPTTELYTVHGMWLNDPGVAGLGYHVYVVAAELEKVFEPSTADGRYWYIVDPPSDPVLFQQARERIDSVEMELAPAEGDPAVARYLAALRSEPDGEDEPKRLDLGDDGADAPPNLLAVVPYPLLGDSGFLSRVDAAKDGRIYLVNDGQPDEYALVSGEVRGPASTVYVLMIDSANGALRRATWGPWPQMFPPVSRDAAIWLGRQQLASNAPVSSCRLVYSRETDPSPFLPHWRAVFDLNGSAATVNVSQLTSLAGDSDGDGMSDGRELYAGMDPSSEKSLFTLAPGEVQGLPGGAVELRWASATNMEYSLYRAGTLPGSFLLLEGHIPATPPENCYTDAPPGSAAFYRVEAE